MPNDVNVSDAFDTLANSLIESERLYVGSFWEFVRDIWSQGFEYPDLFKAWHIELICREAEEAAQKGKYYCVILPRGHFKSTILGHAFSVWRLIKMNKSAQILYLSFSDIMAESQMRALKQETRNNPVLARFMKDLEPRSRYTWRFLVNGHEIEIIRSSITSFKRGLHVDGGMIADDILKDPENPLNPSEVLKVEDSFMRQAMFIPNKNAPIIVVGTPMMPDDILAKLREDERFIYRRLPVFNPVDEEEQQVIEQKLGRPINPNILFPERWDDELLKSHQKENSKAFETEFMLNPFLLGESFFLEEDIMAVENPMLKSLKLGVRQETDAQWVTAGFDIGLKRHPSHLVVFAKRGEKIVQLHQSWMENTTYQDQIEVMNRVVRNFDVDEAYFDNTRGEIEYALQDGSLNKVWKPLSLNLKAKYNIARAFDVFVKSKKLQLISDRRQRSQIICVNNELKAPQTPLGHGDSFWSIAMALRGMERFEGTGGAKVVGNMQDFSSLPTPDQEDRQKLQETMERWKSYSNSIKPICPKCKEVGGWIPERPLCLLCLNRKTAEELLKEDEVNL